MKPGNTIVMKPLNTVEWGHPGFGSKGRTAVAEAVGMWKSRRDFQGRWKGWETCSWFSNLSTDRHFHSLLLS